MPTAALLALAAWAAGPAFAQRASSATLRLALIEDVHARISTTLDDALARALTQASSSASLVSVQTLPCYYSDGDYRLRIPLMEVQSSTLPAAAFETDAEAAFVFPDSPGLAAALWDAARLAPPIKPWALHLSSRTASVSLSQGAGGQAVITAAVDPRKGEPARWHSTMTLFYRLRWEGRIVSVAVIGKPFGGLSRLASALARERARGPVLGVARGGIFGEIYSQTRGKTLAETLQKLGLAYSAVNSSELRRWPELLAYRKDHPEGIQFLSANIVYSSAPAVTLLPAFALVPVGGLTVAVTAVTPPSSAKYLPQAGLGNLTILDPVQAVESRVRALRSRADAVVLLGDVDEETWRLRTQARGVDLLLAEDAEYLGAEPEPQAEASQAGRSSIHPPLWTMRAFPNSLNFLEASIASSRAGLDWRVSERHLTLDESVPDAPGLSEFDPEAYGISFSTDKPLIPSARRIFDPRAQREKTPVIREHEFWTMAASLLAEETRSELAFVRIWPLPVEVDDDVREGVVRAWLRTDDPVVTVMLKGSEIKSLLAEEKAAHLREAQGLPPGGRLHFTAGGLDPDEKIHGLSIDAQQFYSVATTQVLADGLALSGGHEPTPVGRTIDDVILGALRRRAGSPPERYARWMEGLPVSDQGLWRVNFRDVGLNVQNTTVVRDDAFASVPNSRIQGFNQLLIGGVLKTDLEYVRDVYRWTDTLETEYARSRLRPRDQPPVTNTTANRIMFLTKGTRRQGSFGAEALARSWGPSLGLQFDGEFESTPGLRRKQVYSAYPGLEFYDGTFVRSLEVSGNVKRDLSRDPPNTQYGFHSRALFSKDVGAAKAAKLQGEVYANYYFLTRSDTPQDLRFEGDANLKLQVSIHKYLTVAPFIDFYAFALKVRPVWGYNAMTGITIGFSRIWKPQYESF